MTTRLCEDCGLDDQPVRERDEDEWLCDFCANKDQRLHAHIESVIEVETSTQHELEEAVWFLDAMRLQLTLAQRDRDAALEALRPFAEVSKKVKGKDEACWCGQDGAVIRYRDLRLAEDLVTTGDRKAAETEQTRGAQHD